jgi:PAS domain S-box-containing protein
MRSRRLTCISIGSSLVRRTCDVNSRVTRAAAKQATQAQPLQFNGGPLGKHPERIVPDEARSGRMDSSDETLRLALDSLVDHAFVTLDAKGMVTSWNTGAERLFGRSREQTVGLPVSAVFRTHGPETTIGTVELERVTQQAALTSAWSLTCVDGDPTYTDTTIRALRSDAGLIGYVLLAYPPPAGPASLVRAVNDTAPDETRRELSESKTLLAAEIADRRQAEASRSRLLGRLVVAQEEERRRLARELHDGLGQRLTALRLSLEALEKVPAEQRTDVAAALETLARIDQDVDFIAWELRPAALDELGLTRVLDTYVREWSRHAGILAVFHSRPGNLERFAPEVEASVYRIAQEALNNVAKHAGARSVNVLLELRGETLALVVEDDGRGFQHAIIGEKMIGLSGMRERALAVGGTVEIEPTPGGGTTVLANIPITGAHSERWSATGANGNASSDPGPALGDVSPESSGAAGQAHSAIRMRLQELQRAVGVRDEFIATVAHELRNPIAPLTFQVRLALNKTEQMTAAGTPVATDWVQSQLRGIEQRLHRLLETLDRLLDMSRLSTGRIDLQPEPMNLVTVVRDVIGTLEAEFAIARCKLNWSEHGDTTGTWDRLRVEQICRNLLSNACRFGAGHPIEVSVSADHDFATLRVRDHGVGIASNQQARIFERFERGVEQRSGGFGIGLWIVRNICVAMGGTVTVQSELGDGACFTVMLPRRPVRPSGSAELEFAR